MRFGFPSMNSGHVWSNCIAFPSRFDVKCLPRKFNANLNKNLHIARMRNASGAVCEILRKRLSHALDLGRWDALSL